MIVKINKIKDFGVFKNFNGTTLPEFKQLNLFYGWNYSGKTTLSRVFRCFEKGKIHDDYSAAIFEFSHAGGKYDNILAAVPNIRVFNSDFIKENLKWDADKIEPVLLLGEKNIELQKKLEETGASLKALEEKLATSRANREEKDKKLKKALTAKAKAVATLLSLNAFDRDHLIKLVDVTKSEDLLAADEFDKSKTRATSTERKPIIQNLILSVTPLPSQVGQVKQLLSKKVSSTGKIQKLLDDKTLSSWTEQGRTIHKDKNLCEFCGNSISKDLLEKLNNHFSREYDIIKADLVSAISTLEKMKINASTLFPAETAFYSDIQLEFQLTKPVLENEILKFNKIIDSLVNDLKRKQTEPFNDIALTTIDPDLEKLQAALKAFNSCIDKNNQMTSSFDLEKKEAIDKVKRHMAAEFESVESYSTIKAELLTDQKAIEEIKNGIDAQKGSVAKIQSQLSETVKGASQINSYLKIFFGKDDVQIEATADNKFKLIRGKEVAKNLSEGEKTAISFVYFTAKLEEHNNKLSDTIVYIDDPVSSLDSTHLFNIYSFIKNTFYQLGQDQNGGTIHVFKSKQLFISTHSFEFYNLVYDWFDKTKKDQKTYLTVERTRNPHKDESTIKESSMLIQKYKSEYAYLFSIIFNFHKTPSDATESIYYLPNILRKFVETYLNFKYLSAGSLDESIDKLIPNTVDCERARKFMHYFSHSLTTDSFMKFPDLAECTAAVKIVLEAVEKHDSIHYKSLLDRMQGSM